MGHRRVFCSGMGHLGGARSGIASLQLRARVGGMGNLVMQLGGAWRDHLLREYQN